MHCFLLACFLPLNISVWFVDSALSEEEKTSLRAGLITNFNEPVNQVSGENGIYWQKLQKGFNLFFFSKQNLLNKKTDTKPLEFSNVILFQPPIMEVEKTGDEWWPWTLAISSGFCSLCIPEGQLCNVRTDGIHMAGNEYTFELHMSHHFQPLLFQSKLLERLVCFVQSPVSWY